MKDAPDIDPVVGVRIAAILGRHQRPVSLLTNLTQRRRVGMAIAQNEADLGRNLAE